MNKVSIVTNEQGTVGFMSTKNYPEMEVVDAPNNFDSKNHKIIKGKVHNRTKTKEIELDYVITAAQFKYQLVVDNIDTLLVTSINNIKDPLERQKLLISYNHSHSFTRNSELIVFLAKELHIDLNQFLTNAAENKI